MCERREEQVVGTRGATRIVSMEGKAERSVEDVGKRLEGG
jgi:hypothetical protein